jgi:polyhydroxybutyrate depolymerase
VLSFHGHSGSALAQQKITAFSSLADRADFLVVYPLGTIGPDGRTGWATGPRKDPTVDDVGFVSALLTHVETLVCVDHSRIYATGFSNGGAMTALLACKMADRIAAFAAISGSYFPVAGHCDPGRAVPLLEIHGTGDRVVPYIGSTVGHLPAIPTWLSGWASRDKCTLGPTLLMRTASEAVEAWTKCAGDGIVMHYALIGGSHAWPRVLYPPGSAQPVSTAEVIWTFLNRYSLTPASSRSASSRAA